MKCPICKHGETEPGEASITLERDGVVLVVRNVPAEVCDNCGEAYHSAKITETLQQQAEVVVRAGVEVDVRQFTGRQLR